MTETPETGIRKSPYAVPYDQIASAAQVGRAELVVEQPHEPPHDVPGPGVDGDGD